MIIGIDFGTSTTTIAIRTGTDNNPEIVPIGKGESWIPSVIGLTDPLSVGDETRKLDDATKVLSVKSGLTDIDEWMKEREYPLYDEAQVVAWCASIITHAVELAKKKSKLSFDKAEVYMGCPALWTGHNRRIIAEIAHKVGLDVDVTAVIDEPVAAGVFWANTSWKKNPKLVRGKTIVFDAGGGTLDVALLNIDGEEVPKVTVLSAESITEAGDKIDHKIYDYLLTLNPKLDKSELSKSIITDGARRIKELLSFEDVASYQVVAPVDALLTLSRNELEKLVDDQVSSSIKLVERVLRKSLFRTFPEMSTIDMKLFEISPTAEEVNNVVLVGGLSRMPIFEKRLKKLFPKAEIRHLEDPQSAVAIGLTYSDTSVRLNLPRPPFSFVVNPVNYPKQKTVVYEAYDLLYDPNDAIRGNNLLGKRRFFEEFSSGMYEFSCELPDRVKTKVKLLIVKDGNEKEVESLMIEHDQRSKNGVLTFVLYASGRWLLQGAKEKYVFNAESWGSAHYGSDKTAVLRLNADSSTSYNYESDSKSSSSKK